MLYHRCVGTRRKHGQKRRFSGSSVQGPARAPEHAPYPRVCAHRGIPSTCPENTLPSFAAALAARAEEIELDLRLSADGVPVVCHDESLERTTGRAALVSELPWEEIRTLDATRLGDPAWRPTSIPRFEEVIDLVGGRAVLNIHLKDPGPGGSLVAVVARLLGARGLDRAAYVAGNEELLAAALELCPEIDRACLARQREPEQQIEVAARYRCARVQFGRSAPEAALAEARARGMIRNLFWADEPQEARQWVQRGIDVILTNRAHAITSALLRSDGPRASTSRTRA